MSELAFDPFDPASQSVNQDPHQCFHYHSIGHRCGSPAISGEYFCYHHRDSLRPAPVVIFPTSPFELPRLTDRASILRAADEVASRIAGNSLDLRRAKALLSAIYIAAAHLPLAAPAPAPSTALPSLQPELHAILEIEIQQTASIAAPQTAPALPAEARTSDLEP